MGDAQLVWMGRTEPCYELVDLGAYPGATEGGATAIYGELYAIREGVLRELDVLEEVPDVYQRKCTSIDGHRAFIYLLRPEHARGRPRIASGVWPIHRRG
jgi:gamma-glutamylaminecyclotransferase